MANKMVVDMVEVQDRWLKLMLEFQNSTKTVFMCSFPTKTEANVARRRMNGVIATRESWFKMLVCQRGCDIYVIKLRDTQEVVIKDG